MIFKFNSKRINIPSNSYLDQSDENKQYKSTERAFEKKIIGSRDSETQDNKILNDININDLVSHDGYLYSLYKILPKGHNWLTGWEISKILHYILLSDSISDISEIELIKLEDIIENTHDSLNISGFLGNQTEDFISGFLYFQSIIKLDINYVYYIYNCTLPYILDNSISTKIIDIPTVDIDNLKYNSPSICRYINNFVKSDIAYLNFSISTSIPYKSEELSEEFEFDNYDIKNTLPTFLSLHDNHGILVTSCIWDIEKLDIITLYLFTLNCMFTNIYLADIIWEKKIWIFCYDRNDLFDKIKYIDIIESSGYDLNKIKSNFDEFKDTYNKCMEFNKKMKEERDILSLNNKKDEDHLIKDWLNKNEQYLDRISTKKILL